MNLSSFFSKILYNLETISRITISMVEDLVLDTTMAEEKRRWMNNIKCIFFFEENYSYYAWKDEKISF